MDCLLWGCFGIAMILVWDPCDCYDIAVGVLWYCCGIDVGFLWDALGLLKVLLWDCHGIAAV